MLSKPINVSPCNKTINSKDIPISYTLPNSQEFDGAFVSINSLEDGSEIASVTISETGNSVNTTLNCKNYGEYSWSSFYYKTPAEYKGTAYTAVYSDDDNIRLSPLMTPFYQTSIKYVDNDLTYHSPSPAFRIEYFEYSANGYANGSRYFREKIYGSRSSNASNVVSPMKFATGDKEDYYGYPIFAAGYLFQDKFNEIDLEDCVVELFVNNTCITRTKILGYFSVDSYENYWYIIDDWDFWDKIDSLDGYGYRDADRAIFDDEGGASKTGVKMLNLTKIKFYSTSDVREGLDMSGILKYTVDTTDGEKESFHYIKRYAFDKDNYSLSIVPNVKIPAGKTVIIWNSSQAEFQIAPTCYFKSKDLKTLNVSFGITTSNLVRTPSVKGSFSPSTSGINYSFWYLYALNNKTYEWDLVEKSPMVVSDNSYTFDNLVNKQEYKIIVVGTDTDGDEWTSTEKKFTANFYKDTTKKLVAAFDSDKSVVDIDYSALSITTDNSAVLYKVRRDEARKVYKSERVGFLSKDATIISDYNICNDTYYDYYVSYNDGSYDKVCYSNTVYTEFDNTSILGIKNIAGDWVISDVFDLKLHFDNNLETLTNEMSREYIDTFSKYPVELKGHQNYISSSCKGLLGNEKDGIYAEPKGLRDAWIDFVNDDSVKLYKGIDGKTMIISIESSSIKPYNFPGVGIVNEINMSFKEIAPVSNYSIYTTKG